MDKDEILEGKWADWKKAAEKRLDKLEDDVYDIREKQMSHELDQTKQDGEIKMILNNIDTKLEGHIKATPAPDKVSKRDKIYFTIFGIVSLPGLLLGIKALFTLAK